MNINKNIIQSFLIQIPIQILGVVVGIIIARIIGPEGKGVLAIYQANSQILTVFFSLSIGNVLTYYVPSNIIPKEKLLGISLFLIVIASTFIFFTTLFFNYSSIKSVLFTKNANGVLYIIWGVLFSSLSVLTGIGTGFLQGLRLFSVLNKILMVNSILNFLFFALLYFLHYLNFLIVNVEVLLYCLLLLLIINCIQFVIPFITKIKIKPCFKISYINEIKPIINFTLYTHMALFVNFFNTRLNLWILNYYLDEFAIGLFSLAANLIVIFNMISAPIGNVLMPFLSGENGHLKKEMFYKYSKINFTLLFIASFVSFFASIIIIPMLYGKEFKDSVLLFQILLPGILFSCVSRMHAVYIAASNKQQYNLYATLIGFLFSAIFGVYLIQQFGLLGSAIATTLSYVLTSMIMIFFVHCKLKLPFNNYFIMNKTDIKSLFNIVENK